jgi:carboxypeptidase C (cathepsin A)
MHVKTCNWAAMLPTSLPGFIQLCLLPIVQGRGWFTGPTLHAAVRDGGLRDNSRTNKSPPSSYHSRRQAEDEGGGPYEQMESISAAKNVTIRFKQPFICETTPGVNSYSGYVDLDERSHTFFWFFEARSESETKPITLWLNGGPGSDSLIGLLTGWSLLGGLAGG